MRIAFVFIAEAYQVYHGAAVLFELMARPGVSVDVFHLDPATPAQLDRLARAHGVSAVPSTPLDAGLIGGAIRSMRIFGLAKPQVMARNEALLRGYDAIVSTEDGITRLFEGEPEDARPRRILLTHGPAQRKVPSHANRIHCDLILVKGPADVSAYLRDGLSREGHIAAVGYPKFVTTALLADHTPRLFENDNPTVLYNSHKDRSLRSWDVFFEPMMETFRSNRGTNLIVAPHVKLFRRRSESVRRNLRARSDCTILVDPGSDRSLDNTYSEAADIYVGDVSSQVFEFVARPRPCVFLNPHRVKWKGNPHFSAWELGEVIERPDELKDAIERAPTLHPEFIERQKQAAKGALGDTGPQSVIRSADLILRYLAEGRVDP
ncbi:hypothetical protein GRI40_02770 [Altererythrobacter aerius]|uniref:Glycosyl transferase n=1 Tax=Tsuneonella aeria TaxID=1837929 RepID=A0A6I4TBL2_9SPHN|nr:hypothetical protein [Tsuneonella aeria]MXO74144.1 hypothetical protein [Tsuneonella aeria]